MPAESRSTRRWLRPMLALAAALSAATLEGGSDVAARFEAANRLYEEGHYPEAADAYGALLTNGQASAAIFFNRGNAQFKAGQLGRAIVSYRLAEELAPRDPDIRANLAFARQAVAGGGAPQPVAWRRLTRRLTLDEWTLLATASLWSLFGAMILLAWRITWRPTLRRLRLAAALALALSSAGLALAFYDRRLERMAIVIQPETVAHYGPLEESQSSFTARDGAEFPVLDRKDDWVQVIDGSRRIGWLRTRDVLIFPPE